MLLQFSNQLLTLKEVCGQHPPTLFGKEKYYRSVSCEKFANKRKYNVAMGASSTMMIE